jgi:hypothetical protein
MIAFFWMVTTAQDQYSSSCHSCVGMKVSAAAMTTQNSMTAQDWMGRVQNGLVDGGA